MPFPIKPSNPPQVAPNGNPKQRTLRTSGSDSYTGPSYASRSANTDVRTTGGTTKSVRRFGVATGQRGESKR